jgi:molybdenum cofactor cytidylyltransferase
MGQPKQLLRLPGARYTLLEQTLHTALEAGLHPVFVVLGAHAEAIAAAADLQGSTVLHNPDWTEGMASSIRCGLCAVQERVPEAAGVLLLVCDQPALTREHLQALLAAHHAEPEAILASRYAETNGVPMLAPRALLPELAALTGDRGARALLRNPHLRVTGVPFSGGAWDVDTEADLSSA